MSYFVSHNSSDTHTFEQVIEQIKLFKPPPRMIKLRIEELITGDYLERDPKDRALYQLRASHLLLSFSLPRNSFSSSLCSYKA